MIVDTVNSFPVSIETSAAICMDDRQFMIPKNSTYALLLSAFVIRMSGLELPSLFIRKQKQYKTADVFFASFLVCS